MPLPFLVNSIKKGLIPKSSGVPDLLVFEKGEHEFGCTATIVAGSWKENAIIKTSLCCNDHGFGSILTTRPAFIAPTVSFIDSLYFLQVLLIQNGGKQRKLQQVNSGPFSRRSIREGAATVNFAIADISGSQQRSNGCLETREQEERSRSLNAQNSQQMRTPCCRLLL